MTPQTKQLYEAAKRIANRNLCRYDLLNVDWLLLNDAITSFEQSIQKEPDNGKTRDKVEKYIFDNYGERWLDKYATWAIQDIIDAIVDFSDQQTAPKDKEIKELKQRISVIKEKLPDNKIRDLNPIWVRDEIISELEKLI